MCSRASVPQHQSKYLFQLHILCHFGFPLSTHKATTHSSSRATHSTSSFWGFQQQTQKMVKFSKQFEGQLIPEWKEAFVDYWQLKKDLKKLHLFNNTNNTPNNTSTSLPKYIFSSLRNYSPFGHQHREHGPIQVIHLSLKTHI